MPPRVFSRYALCSASNNEADEFMLSEPPRYTYRDRDDNIMHTVTEGDTLWSIAARYYAAADRGAGLWWVIADFQPEPIYDPTIAPRVGSTIIVPSLQTVLTEVFAESRRLEEPV